MPEVWGIPLILKINCVSGQGEKTADWLRDIT